MSSAAVQKDWRNRVYVNRGNLRINATGTRRRIRALQALGWTAGEIGARMGVSAYRVQHLASDRYQWVLGDVRERVDSVYEALSMCVPPMDHRHAQVAARAAAKGWAKPLEWDDIDNPEEKPVKQAGRVSYSSAELVHEYEHFTREGFSQQQIADRLGVKLDSLQAAIRRAGRKEPVAA